MWLFVVTFFLTLDFQKNYSDSRFYTPARLASNWLMSAAPGWILLGGLVICGYLWLFVVLIFLTQDSQKFHSDSRFYTQARPASNWLMSAAPGWILLEGLVFVIYLWFIGCFLFLHRILQVCTPVPDPLENSSTSFGNRQITFNGNYTAANRITRCAYTAKTSQKCM